MVDIKSMKDELEEISSKHYEIYEIDKLRNEIKGFLSSLDALIKNDFDRIAELDKIISEVENHPNIKTQDWSDDPWYIVATSLKTQKDLLYDMLARKDLMIEFIKVHNRKLQGLIEGLKGASEQQIITKTQSETMKDMLNLMKESYKEMRADMMAQYKEMAQNIKEMNKEIMSSIVNSITNQINKQKESKEFINFKDFVTKIEEIKSKKPEQQIEQKIDLDKELELNSEAVEEKRKRGRRKRFETEQNEQFYLNDVDNGKISETNDVE